MPHQLTLKPSFLNELNALDRADVPLVIKKLGVLEEDPRPDAKVKKQLKGMGGDLHRLRAGDFRIFYTYDSRFVSLLSVRKRDESTYADDVEAEFLGGPSDAPASAASTPAERTSRSWEAWLAPQPKSGTPLSRAIDEDLLEGLGIPVPFRAALTSVATEEELLEAKVPQDLLLKVVDAVVGRPERELAAQPDLVLDDAGDLLRFREGDLLGFLLRLDAEQEKIVGWGVKTAHPTLLKGGPGTGKSTVALYRVRAMIDALKKKGVPEPRLLFTTYTRALSRASEQLLARLLGKDAPLVDVRTADAIVRDVSGLGDGLAFATDQDVREALALAIERAELAGNALEVASQRAALEKLGSRFMLDEIRSVIEARGLDSIDAYRETPRSGRQRALTRLQRDAVWRVSERFRSELASRGKTTWEHLRIHARDRVRSGAVPPRYDGVVIDEAQDLPATTLAALVGLARTRGGIFLTADANQSIYGSSFRWKDVHEHLSFVGSTATLRANHRSTREIGEAAEAYLADGTDPAALDADRPQPAYVHEGAVPAVRAVQRDEDEARLLARFFRGAARDLRLGLGGCAVLVPTNAAALRIADDLRGLGLDAHKVDARDLDLDAPGVKVLTQKSAKGLEFPIVALGGFDRSTGAGEDEARLEARRAMYVAMTRAMRALLVVVPAEVTSPVLTGFTSPTWNIA